MSTRLRLAPVASSTSDPIMVITRPPAHYGLGWSRRLVFGWREALCHARAARRFGWECRVRGASVVDLCGGPPGSVLDLR